MVRREMLGLMGAGAAGLMFAGGGTARADHEKGGHDEHIEHLGKCAMHCARAASHCLEQLCAGAGDREMHAKTVAIASSCKEFCTLTAGLLACNSPLSKYSFEGCASACRDCAEICGKGHHSEVMKACAEMCKKCEQMCMKMHKEHGAGGTHHSSASK